MKNFRNKSVVSLLLALLILLSGFNSVFAAKDMGTVEAPKNVENTAINSGDRIFNPGAIPDPGSIGIQDQDVDDAYKADLVERGADTPVPPVPLSSEYLENPLFYWNGINNNPTRVIASVNGDPRTEMGFNWYTSEKANSHVLISTSKDMENPVQFNATVEEVQSVFLERNDQGNFFGQSLRSNKTEHIYKAKATGLMPNTTYYYQVGSNEEGFGYSPIGSFKTAGNKGEDFSFIHITDTQNWYGNQFRMDEAWYGASTLEEALKIDPKMDFIVHTGDIVEISEAEDEWVDNLEKSKKFLMSKMLVPASGNHDELSFDNGYSRPYDFNRHFNVPVTNDAIDGGSYYSYDYNGVHFIVANTNDYKTDGKMIGPDQREWIKEDVKKARENGAEWVIMAYHKPLYSKSYHSLSDRDILAVKQEMMEFIDEYNIDLCMQGHDHVLARTKSLQYTPQHRDVYAEIADNGVNGENKLYKDTPGTIFVLPNMAGTKAYDDFYSKGLEHTKKMRPNLSWMTQEDLDHYNSLFALGGQPAQHSRFATKYSNNRDSTIQNFAHYEFKNGDLHVKMYQVEGQKGSERTTKVIDEFTLSKTKYYDVNFLVDSDKATVSGETTFTKVKEGTPVVELGVPKVESKEGYVFKGWSPVIEGTVDRDITFTAEFEKVVAPEPVPTPSEDNSTSWLVSRPIFFDRETNKEDKNEKKDVKISDITGHWAESVIRRVVNKGYMDLIDGDKFYPNRDAKRVTYVKALGRMEGIDPTKYMDKKIFSDVVPGTEEAGYINWAYEKGIVKGNGEGKFEGDREITRQEIAAILNRYVKTMNKNLPTLETKPFADEDKIANWALQDVKEAQAKGIFAGKDNNLFDPIANITRAEVAQVIDSMDK